MTSPSYDATPVLVDYWLEIARRGVAALRFVVQRHGGETWMAAELASPRTGMVLRAAHAALEIDKVAASDSGSPIWLLRFALSQRLAVAAGPPELAAYQAALADRLHQEIRTAPALALARLADPHDTPSGYGRS
ncbi:hypothetical protein [Caulobacter endophyticus]|uniref:Uncharacterized protein n=1 Tax=Caulobacter endophyticus TaxID=2172652 RepID=A0A2T9JI88_9CAUL|nr:hypothetical protein [Caulobacter endophyticus]PVM83404.1 hypothetical protein DDF67_20930 [Caulobacter endophyticus]